MRRQRLLCDPCGHVGAEVTGSTPVQGKVALISLVSATPTWKLFVFGCNYKTEHGNRSYRLSMTNEDFSRKNSLHFR